MSENKSGDKKSTETKQSSTRKKLVKVKKLKNTADMTGTVGGQAGGGQQVAVVTNNCGGSTIHS